MIRPLGDVLVVRALPDVRQTPGGVLLVGAAEYRSGIIERVGPGRWKVRDSSEAKNTYVFVATQAKVGQRVTWKAAVEQNRQGSQYAFWLEQHDAEDLVLIRESDVLWVEQETACSSS